MAELDPKEVWYVDDGTQTWLPYPGAHAAGSQAAAMHHVRPNAHLGWTAVRCEVWPARSGQNQYRLEDLLVEPGESVYEDRDTIWADLAAMLNAHADTWEEDGTDPCRVRVAREWANALRTYAEGVGVPSIQTLREKNARLAEALEQAERGLMDAAEHLRAVMDRGR